MSGIGLGRDHDAGGFLVDPVNYAGPRYPANAGKTGTTVVQQGVDDGAGLVAGRRVHGDARRLVDDDQVGVFVEDGERDVLRQGDGRRRWGDIETVGPRLSFRRAVDDRNTVAGHPAFSDQRLNAAPRQIGEPGRQPLVDAARRRVGFYDQKLHQVCRLVVGVRLSDHIPA